MKELEPTVRCEAGWKRPSTLLAAWEVARRFPLAYRLYLSLPASLVRQPVRFYRAGYYRRLRLRLQARYNSRALASIIVSQSLRFQMLYDLNSGHDLEMFVMSTRNELYEPEIVRWIRRELPPGGMFIDIGCNNGYFSVLASQIVGSSGSVWAFEPNPQAGKRARANFELNNAQNVRIYELALGDEPGLTNFFVDALDDGLSRIIDGHRAERSGPELSVQVETLDNLLTQSPKPTLIKIDVEGSEFKVLTGMARLLQSPACPVLIVEWNPAYADTALFDFLTRRFRLYISDNDGGSEREVTARQPDHLPHCNLLCRPRT